MPNARATDLPLIVFDFDGTLADTFALFVELLGTLAARHRFRRPEDHEIAGLRLLDARGVLKALGLPVWRVPPVLLDFHAAMQERLAELQLFDGIEEALHRLADAGAPVALASSNSRHNVEAVLGEGLRRRFAHIECGSALFGKAHGLRRVLRHTGARAAGALYVGDEVRDAHAAAACGMRFGAVAWGYTELAALRPLAPAVTFAAAADLAKALDFG